MLVEFPGKVALYGLLEFVLDSLDGCVADERVSLIDLLKPITHKAFQAQDTN